MKKAIKGTRIRVFFFILLICVNPVRSKTPMASASPLARTSNGVNLRLDLR